MVKESTKVKMVYGDKDIGRMAKKLNELFTNKNDLIYFLKCRNIHFNYYIIKIIWIIKS
jgi:hypothetical protein